MFFKKTKVKNGNLMQSEGFQGEPTWSETSGEPGGSTLLVSKVMLTCNGATKEVFLEAKDLIETLLAELNTRIDDNNFEPRCK